MSDLILTWDNPQLSGPTNDDGAVVCAFTEAGSLQVTGGLPRAINCTNGVAVRDLIEHSVSDNTRAAYASDLKHFHDWGGTLPATSETIASYVAAYAGKLSVATIARRLATLSKAHQAMEDYNPCQSALVKSTLKGLRRKYGVAQKQAKALIKEDLFVALDHIGHSMKDVRDYAILILGFAGGFRRSELVGLDVADIEHVRQGLIIKLRHSKTDQEGVGRKIGILHGRTRHCPVAAIKDWLTGSGITEGPIFRPINRHGQIQSGRLSGDAVSEVIRERLAIAGMAPEGYSGHSLRSGFATSAAQAGVSTLKIRAQTGHASDAMLSKYVRDGELFIGNAAGIVL
jgi:integrase